jgi:hypothetical protein
MLFATPVLHAFLLRIIPLDACFAARWIRICVQFRFMLYESQIVERYIRAVWMPALGATLRLRCGRRFGRHTYSAKYVAWCGVAR